MGCGSGLVTQGEQESLLVPKGLMAGGVEGEVKQMDIYKPRTEMEREVREPGKASERK